MAWLTDRTWTRLLVCGLVVLATCEAASADSRSPVEPVPVVSAEHSIFDPGTSLPEPVEGRLPGMEATSSLRGVTSETSRGSTSPRWTLRVGGATRRPDAVAGWGGPDVAVGELERIRLPGRMGRRAGRRHRPYLCGASESVGEVLDSPPLRVSNGVFPSYAPKIAWNGSNFLVVWQQNQGNDQMDVYMARITPGGSVPRTRRGARRAHRLQGDVAGCRFRRERLDRRLEVPDLRLRSDPGGQSR